MAFKVLDLFSGAGGLSRGFYDAGYDVVLGVDFDEAALKTFKANHGGAEAMKLDLFDHGNIDVIIDFLEKKIESYKLDMEASKAEYEKPFAYEEELKSKIARQYELNAQLDLENGKVEDVDLAASEDKDIAQNVAEEKSPYRTGMDGYKR